MTPGERLARLDDLERGVRAILDGDAEPAVKLQATRHLDEIKELRRQAALLATRTATADPITRAHAREAEERAENGLHPLRKGRDQCSARRRDGSQCQAPAVPWTLVCRRHGGSAPQVLIKARHIELQAALHNAVADYQAAKGTNREFDALCTASAARRDLDDCEAKLERIAELRARLRRQKAASRAAEQLPCD